MSQFRHKPTVVTAYQFNGHSSMETMPAEIRETIDVRPSDTIGTMYFLSGHVIRKGEWLVHDDDGITTKLPDSKFKKLYEVI